MCNENKNIIGLIDGSQGFARCAQILLATKIGGATSIPKPWVKLTMGSWGLVGTRIVLVQLGKIFLAVEVRRPRKYFYPLDNFPRISDGH